MYNTDLPTRAELPTSAQLKRSTIIAATSAAVLLVTIVLPSEYAVDPTGIGRVLGLNEMGEIKLQLAQEAAADAAAAGQILPIEDDIAQSKASAADSSIPAQQESQSEPVAPEPLAATETQAVVTPKATASAEPAQASGSQSDELSFVLTPGEGIEIKLVMKAGAKASYSWTTSGGPVNFDTHGDGGGNSISYEKGRGMESDEGVLEAAFDGNHGWFWRNRGEQNVTVTLRTSGDYIELKRVM